ncbi:MAG TPA: hypothetical protein VFQ45_17010 [Longimicrobium sp.]|nr:hypothetical protein [Longimicrobium sp.]
MRVRTFYCWALAAPVLLPLLVGLPLVRLDLDPFQGIGQFLVGSLAVAGIPYVIFAGAFFVWSEDKTETQVRHAALAAPLLFAPFATVFWSGMAMFQGASAGGPMLMGLAMFVLIFGYFYVFLGLAAHHVLRRRLIPA